MSTSNAFTILYHGNCIDGWFSAYIAHTYLKMLGSITMYPISPNQQSTWPKKEDMAGTHILLLDISVAEEHRSTWTSAGALSVNCIDHHASAVAHWPATSCPINTASCAAIQTWQHFYPTQSIPSWLYHIDRIDRWDNPTYEDRCIREILNIIAHKPVQQKLDEAFALTERFLLLVNTPIGVMSLLEEGKQILDQKDYTLMTILNRGAIHIITEAYISAWNLPSHWLGASVYIIDNTHITLDTTEAAHLVFMHYPAVTAFINYRKKTIYGRGPTAVEKELYVYSARSRGFDLTTGTLLKGHATSAGCSLVKGEVPNLPFIITSA